jgi:hypothetical protein
MYFKDVGYRQRYFPFEKGPGTQSDPKFGRRGLVLVIPMPGKNVPERRSGLRPSEKELSVRSVTKILLGIGDLAQIGTSDGSCS